VPQERSRVARGPFLVAVIAVLAAGLLGLLGLNTALAQDSFHLHELQLSNKQLADREQVLQHEVDGLQAPAALAAQALAQGMLPGGPPVFLRLPDGTVLGQPVPATAPPAPVAAPAPVPVPGAAKATPTPSPAVTGPAVTGKAATGKATTGQTATPSPAATAR